MYFNFKKKQTAVSRKCSSSSIHADGIPRYKLKKNKRRLRPYNKIRLAIATERISSVLLSCEIVHVVVGLIYIYEGTVIII